MKIKDIKVFVCCPGRNFVTVKIVTDNGIYGLGDKKDYYDLQGNRPLPPEET